MRKCYECKELKELVEFHQDKTRKDGKSYLCKRCTHNKRITFKVNNLEKYANYHQEYREKNSDKILEYARNYYYLNKEKMNNYNRLWVKENPEKKKIIAAKVAAKRRSILDIAGTFTTDEWVELCDTYDNTCINCGKDKITIDHIIPLSQGGTNTIDNLQPLCQSCNSKKGIKTIDYRTNQ